MKNKWIKMFSMFCFMFVFLFAINLVNVNATATEEIRTNTKISFSGKKAIKIKWGNVVGATGYDVYFRSCDGESFTKKDVRSTKKNSIVIKKYQKKPISNKKAYKAVVKAYKKVDGKKVIIASTYGLHVVGSKNAKETNIKSISFAKNDYTLEIGKTEKLSAKCVKVNKKKAFCKHDKVIKYYSADKSIVSVDATGVIKAIAAGSTTVYAVAPNGLSAKAKVTVPEKKSEPKAYTINFHWVILNFSSENIERKDAQVPGRVFTKYVEPIPEPVPESIISEIKPNKYGTLSGEVNNKQITVEEGTDLSLYVTHDFFDDEWEQYSDEIREVEQYAPIVGMYHQKKGAALPADFEKKAKKFGYYDGAYEYLEAGKESKDYEGYEDYFNVYIRACEYDLKNIQEDIDLYIFLEEPLR